MRSEIIKICKFVEQGDVIFKGTIPFYRKATTVCTINLCTDLLFNIVEKHIIHM